jgi:hypothetical protein
MGMWLAFDSLLIVIRGRRRALDTLNSRTSRGRKRRLRTLLVRTLGAVIFGWIIPSLEIMMVEAVVVVDAVVVDVVVVVDVGLAIVVAVVGVVVEEAAAALVIVVAALVDVVVDVVALVIVGEDEVVVMDGVIVAVDEVEVAVALEGMREREAQLLSKERRSPSINLLLPRDSPSTRLEDPLSTLMPAPHSRLDGTTVRLSLSTLLKTRLAQPQVRFQVTDSLLLLDLMPAPL